ncbi:TBC domain-containing protein C23D3.03c [Lasiodiplodia hormozganensis]|nr:TBC domain-containing protein C23D3.03c [Lasiodiplodia hormozganensis]
MPATSCGARAPLHPYIPRLDAPTRAPWPSLASIAEQPFVFPEHALREPVTLDALHPSKAPRLRPLLRPMTLQTMHAFHHPPAPDSPPDLTDSKSSKSSSLPDSSLSELPGPHDISHFEDITLDDIKTTTLHADKRDSAKAFVPRSPMAPTATLARSTTLPTPGPAPSRDLTTAAKPAKPGLRVNVNGSAKEASSTLGIPSRRSMRRGFISPSTPSLTPGRQSRSPSPAGSAARSPRSPSKRFTAPPSPTSRGGPLDFKPGLMPTVRRQSWQPGRKTVEELEAEYHDSDEDLPDDAIMWNVPMSPRPPHHRASRSPSFSSVAESVPEAKNQDNGPPKSPSRSSTGSSYAASTHSSIPEDSELDVTRTKSWGDALDDLSQEARELTEALEEYAGETERQREARIQSGAASARPSIEKKKSSPSLVQLPPIQKGNIMIDPLPISKEKEKVLSRTRPSWLPPKDPQEERKHLREYQKMMAAAQEAERRMAAKLQEKQQQRDTTQTSISRIWDQHVLPNWDQVINEPRTRELWWRGVTPRSRGTVWKRAIGNELGLSETGYKAALERAKKLDKKLAKLDPESRGNARESVWFDSIRRDANEAYPELKIFQAGGPLHESLLDVLMAYAMYRSDVGYVYGTHLIVGVLILNMSPADAFISLANVLNRSLPMAFLVNDTNAMRRARDLVLKTLHYKIPKLHYHLTEGISLEPEEFLDPLFRTMFCHGPGLDISSRIWDVYVFEGDKSLVRAAVGVLDALEGRLYGSREEVLDLLGWSATQEWGIKDEDAFMRGVRNAGKVDSASTGGVSPGGAR